MKAIIQFSGGAASYVAGRLAMGKYGPENCVWLFADVLTEDEDLYRFNADVQKRTNIPITRIADGRAPWDVFFDEGMIGNSHADMCSRILKRELLSKWLAENSDPETDIVIIGFDADEQHRLEGPRKRIAPWKVEYPLYDEGIFKSSILKRVEIDGLKLPRLYKLGFPHNNCGGACIKAGHAQWKHLLRTFPERYAHHEAKEAEFREKTGKDVSILKDRTGGNSSPLTLRAFRERCERQPELIDMTDWGACSCMESSLDEAA